MWQHILHYSFHFLLPGLIAFVFYRNSWKKVWLIFLATMLIDLDHLVATPIFDPNRCSIDVHLLHSYLAFGIYLFLLLFKKSRIVGVALVLHIIADLIDCYMQNI